ncbi:MAG TPA: hypothetical protein ENF80_04780 [Thermofilum sp.]|nr:hypothetical protein [Thermofilum sp.]
MEIILTHGDLDGLTSAAIVYDVLVCKGEKVSIRIAQPFNLYQALREIRSINKLEKLWIMDIGIDEATWRNTRNELHGILSKGTRIIWVDHHVATLKHFLELSEMGITLLFESERCTVTIIGKALLHLTSDPSFYKKLIIIGEVGDKVRRVGDKDPLYSIIEVLGSSLAYMPVDDAFKVNLIKMWVNEKKLVNDEIVLRAENAIKKLEELLKGIDERIIYSGDKIIIIDLRDVKVHGYAGKIASHIASKTGKVALLAFNTNAYETIITCRVPPSREFNASKILPELAEKYNGGGGGHEKAASIRIPVTMFEDVIKEFRKLESQIK